MFRILGCVLVCWISACGGGKSNSGPQAGPAPSNTPVNQPAKECGVTGESAFSPEVLSIVAEASGLSVYSITPSVFRLGRGITNEGLQSGERGVFGGVTLNESQHARLASALAALPATDEVLFCHEPRHVIVAERGTQSARIVLCFECMNARIVHSDGREEEALLSSAEANKLADMLDEWLKVAGITLSREVQDKWSE